MADGGAGGQDEVDQEVWNNLRSELRSEYEEHLLEDAHRACERIDRFVLSAIRQLPPEVRRMPAREALRLLPGDARLGGASDASAVGSSPSADAQTQTAIATTPTKRLRKGSDADADDADRPPWMASPESSESRKYPPQKLEELHRKRRELAEFHRIMMNEAPERLEELDSQQRELFMRRAKDTLGAFARVLPGSNSPAPAGA